MLTDAALRNLKPKSKIYKASDRDGMYVTVSPGGTVTFRYDYRLNGRRETLTLGRYGPGGISLAMARELLLDARKAVLKGTSPALEKQREKRRVVAIKTFGAAMDTWLANARLADSTRAMRKHIIDRDILPVFKNRLLTEIQAEDLRALCNKVKERGAPATAVQIRDIVKQVYVYAIAHGEKVDNPADSVGAASIATFVPKDRALSPLEIRLFVQQMESVATYPTIKLALRLILLTLVRKSELIQATWDEVDFESKTWTIPKQRMKGRNPHAGRQFRAGRLQSGQRQRQHGDRATGQRPGHGQSGGPGDHAPQLEHPADADGAAGVSGQRDGEQGSCAAAVSAALHPARTDAMSTTRKLRLGPLPKTENVKLTFTCSVSLKANLDRYAALHAQTYGEAVDATTLIPHMLEAFIAGDRGFRRKRSGQE